MKGKRKKYCGVRAERGGADFGLTTLVSARRERRGQTRGQTRCQTRCQWRFGRLGRVVLLLRRGGHIENGALVVLQHVSQRRHPSLLLSGSPHLHVAPDVKQLAKTVDQEQRVVVAQVDRLDATPQHRRPPPLVVESTRALADVVQQALQPVHPRRAVLLLLLLVTPVRQNHDVGGDQLNEGGEHLVLERQEEGELI